MKYLILFAVIATITAGYFVPAIDVVVATVIKIVVSIGGVYALMLAILLAGFAIGSIKR